MWCFWLWDAIRGRTNNMGGTYTRLIQWVAGCQKNRRPCPKIETPNAALNKWKLLLHFALFSKSWTSRWPAAVTSDSFGAGWRRLDEKACHLFRFWLFFSIAQIHLSPRNWHLWKAPSEWPEHSPSLVYRPGKNNCGGWIPMESSGIFRQNSGDSPP